MKRKKAMSSKEFSDLLAKEEDKQKNPLVVSVSIRGGVCSVDNVPNGVIVEVKDYYHESDPDWCRAYTVNARGEYTRIKPKD